MADQAQGIFKEVAYAKQTAKGTEKTGSGGQLVRRETISLNTEKDTFSSNEIVSHRNYTGDSYGTARQSGDLRGVLSGTTYGDFIGSLLRTTFAAKTSLTGLSLTIAASGSDYTVTRSAGSYLTDGVKIGHIVRLSGGSLHANNSAKNLLVKGVTATVLTVAPVNGAAMTAEGPIASCTLAWPGKISSAAVSSHTNDFYTFEEWHTDISVSRRKYDVQIGKIDLNLPSTGNTTIGVSLMGLNSSKGTSRSLTSPTAETSTQVLNGVNGYLLLGGNKVAIATSLSLSIDGQAQFGESVIASKVHSDIVKGDLKVTGTVTVLFEDDTFYTYFDAETSVSLVMVITDGTSAAANFFTITLPVVKLTSASNDDGKKQIVQTFNLTAEYNGSGGTGTSSEKGCITIQDSTLP